MELEPFSKNSCEKCGTGNWTIYYRPGSYYYGLGVGTINGEHMALVCGGCGYKRITKTMDQS